MADWQLLETEEPGGPVALDCLALCSRLLAASPACLPRPTVTALLVVVTGRHLPPAAGTALQRCLTLLGLGAKHYRECVADPAAARQNLLTVVERAASREQLTRNTAAAAQFASHFIQKCC